MKEYIIGEKNKKYYNDYYYDKHLDFNLAFDLFN